MGIGASNGKVNEIRLEKITVGTGGRVCSEKDQCRRLKVTSGKQK